MSSEMRSIDSGVAKSSSAMFKESGHLEAIEAIQNGPPTDGDELSINMTTEDSIQPLRSIPMSRSVFRNKVPPGLGYNPHNIPIPEGFNPTPPCPLKMAANSSWDPMLIEDCQEEELAVSAWELGRRDLVHRNERTICMRKTEIQMILDEFDNRKILASNRHEKSRARGEVNSIHMRERKETKKSQDINMISL